MFSLAKHARSLRNLSARTPKRRFFSPLAIHSRFPATLHYYRRANRPSLFDRKEIGNRPQDLYDDGVEVAGDGLVYPKAERDGESLALFPKNEFTRNHYDEFLDLKDAGETVDVPRIYTIPKGTSIPESLILIYEHLAWFSLQPSRGMSLQDLNRSLDDFFDSAATKESVESWLASHPFDAASDNAEEAWKNV
ncbi:hypothetical protein BBO_01076 [Beauveria brongniartii RCEF 3172]|uniref:Tse2 ADP-ribosyltransferase toxin domain-containing protein n=1 Tax=Beauveria brongniartii RCEF 3172 TaxID=1081107 RepID=A0A167K2P9_9HYPO|nr:hypothetical protein BBO_01076 [Beauveria brongniartii RCEF 3172]